MYERRPEVRATALPGLPAAIERVGRPFDCKPAWRHAEERRESTGEVGLIEEAHFGRDVREWLAGEDPIAGGFEATPEKIGMRRDPERSREGPGDAGRSDTDYRGRIGQGRRFEEASIEVVAE